MNFEFLVLNFIFWTRITTDMHRLCFFLAEGDTINIFNPCRSVFIRVPVFFLRRRQLNLPELRGRRIFTVKQRQKCWDAWKPGCWEA